MAPAGIAARGRWATIAAALAALVVVLALPGTAAAKSAQCPTFRVLHNDRIGALFFPAGNYQIYIPRHSTLPCPKASNLFARFLARPSGVLPGKWQMKRRRAVFFKKNQP